MWSEVNVLKTPKQRIIAGVGADYFENGPATKNIDILLMGEVEVLTVTAHIVLVSIICGLSIEESVEASVASKPVNVVTWNEILFLH